RWQRWLLRAADAAGAGLGLKPGASLPPPGAVERLLLIRRRHFGDLVLMTPALRRARELFRDAEITLAVNREYHDFLHSTGLPAELNLRLWAPPPGLPVCARPRFDLALDFHAELATLLLGRRMARWLVGSGLRGGRCLLDMELSPIAGLDAATGNLRLVEAAASAAPARAEPPRLPCAPVWLRAATGLLRPVAPAYVVIHPGCGRRAKLWPLGRWALVAQHALLHGWDVVFTGGAGERPRCALLAATIAARRGGRDRVHNLAGQTDWGQLAGIVASAAAVAAPDTGIIHLAQALGTPTVALFGPNDPSVWGYAEPCHRSLVRRLPCSFCGYAQCPLAETAGERCAPCLLAITAGEVIRALEAVARCRPGPAPAVHPALAARAHSA
ncbi:MAG: glycosyltransferase family 9 protein, partial [Terriglobales bacterium]